MTLTPAQEAQFGLWLFASIGFGLFNAWFLIDAILAERYRRRVGRNGQLAVALRGRIIRDAIRTGYQLAGIIPIVIVIFFHESAWLIAWLLLIDRLTMGLLSLIDRRFFDKQRDVELGRTAGVVDPPPGGVSNG